MLIGAGRPKILSVIDKVFLLLLTFFIGEGEGRFFAKRWVSKHIVEPLTGIGEQGVPQCDGHLTVKVADIVKVKIHQAHLEGTGNNFPAPEGFPL